ncbi:hypothetical protein N7474_007621 [Penicillium riverlandense]|uniref:uncharacterized protein n=1 Tax=Penicillium riverlandense TaxID=1903569 RepID=UPI0025497F15|nr:uncharacterized protein N7474_007621 [Penicillium riverlandense]KAJ5811320.1 hypothetical protein N7474_007621 [Penicillium riverlandense]
MSGSPPEEEPSQTSAEKPRAQPTSESVTSTTVEETGTGPSQQLPAVSEALPSRAPLPEHGEQSALPPLLTSSLPPPGPPSYPAPTVGGSTPVTTVRSLGPRPTRRTKAHVASACVNCKKKHLGCDSARPCRRCVLAGKASSCVDVTHKKRGRPPLKAEDSSLQTFTTQPEAPSVPGVEAQPAAHSRRNPMHRATSSREIRPVTDLRTLGEAGSPVIGGGVPRDQPQRWSASVFPLTRPMGPAPSIPGAAARRPFSSGSAVPPALSQPPPAFASMAGGFHPILTGSMPAGMERRFHPYIGPALPPPTSPSQHQPSLGVPLLPYSDIRPPMGDPRLAHTTREGHIDSPVRLPPIHQATARPSTPHHAHRLSDPYPTTWALSGRQESLQELRPADSLHRPVFSHPFSHQRSSSTAGPIDPTPRHTGPIELPSAAAPGQSPSTGTRIEPSSTEAESQEPRPVKRRRMALDDMVND